MYIDPFALRVTFFGACGGLLLALAIFFITDTGNLLWRRSVAAVFLVLGVLALILALAS